MEKLFLVLLLNSSPEQEPMVSRFVVPDCITMANVINNNPVNPVVYQDELGDVMQNVAACEYANGQRIVVPTILRKGN